MEPVRRRTGQLLFFEHGAENLIELLQETIALASRDKRVTKRELAQVNVETTVQKENITPASPASNTAE